MEKGQNPKYQKTNFKEEMMNKGELLNAVKAKTGATAKDTEAFFVALWDSIKEELAAGGEVNLSGIGAFKVKERAERESINPRTKEKVCVPAKKVVTFKPSKVW